MLIGIIVASRRSEDSRPVTPPDSNTTGSMNDYDTPYQFRTYAEDAPKERRGPAENSDQLCRDNEPLFFPGRWEREVRRSAGDATGRSSCCPIEQVAAPSGVDTSSEPDVVPERSDAFDLDLDRVAVAHGANTLWCPRRDDVATFERREFGDLCDELRDGEN